MIQPETILDAFQAACRSILERDALDDRRPLRLTQREAYRAFDEFLSDPTRTAQEKMAGYFEIPTGIGKTGFFGALLAEIHDRAEEDGYALRSMVLTPTINLLSAVRDDLETNFPPLSGKVGLYGGGSQELGKPLTVITYDSWINLIKTGALSPDSIHTLVSDEAHRGTSEIRSSAASAFNNTFRLAFTASSLFHAKKNVGLTHDTLIYEKHIAQAIHDGELASYIQVIPTIIRLAPQQQEADTVALSQSVLRQIAYNRFVEELLLDGIDPQTGELLTSSQGAIFVQNTTQANRLETSLNSNSILSDRAKGMGYETFAAAIHTVGMTTAEQDARLEAYKQRKILFLIGDEKFKEGFDHAPMKTIIDIPRGSFVDKIQTIGRGTRQYGTRGLTFIDTILYHGEENPEADKRALGMALEKTVKAIDILDGKVVVRDPKTCPREEPEKASDKTENGDQEESLCPFSPIEIEGASVSINVTAREIRLYQEKCAEAIRIARIAPEGCIELTPEHHRAITLARAAKNSPGAATLYEAFKNLPAREQTNANGDRLFTDPHPADAKKRIRSILNAQSGFAREDEIHMVYRLIDQQPNMVHLLKTFAAELTQERHKKGRMGLEALYAKYKALPDSIRLTPQGQETFACAHQIGQIIDGNIRTLSTQAYRLLTSIIETTDKTINWTNASNRKEMDALREQNGNIGYSKCWAAYNQLPEADRLDSSGFPVFRNERQLRSILEAKSKYVTHRQYSLLITLIEQSSQMVWNDQTPEWHALQKLLKRKGNPGYKAIHTEMTQRFKDVPSSNKWSLDPLLSGSQKNIRRDLYDRIVATVQKMPDSMPWVGSKTHRTFVALRQQKGNPKHKTVMKALRAQAIQNKKPPVMTEAQVKTALYGSLQSIYVYRYKALVEALETFPDIHPARPSVEKTSRISQRKNDCF